MTDELNVGNEISERAHSYCISKQTRWETLTSAYDGYEQKVDYDTLTDDGRAHCGASQFTMKLDPENSGVRLRKRLNRAGNGVQTVKVFIDDKEIGIWHFVQSSFAPVNQSWVESDYEIPASFTQGKTKVTVRLEYVDSDGNNGEVNEYYYWMFCYPKGG